MSKNLLFFIIGNLALFALVYATRKKHRLNNVLLGCAASFFFLSLIETAYRNFLRPVNRTVHPNYTMIADTGAQRIDYSHRIGYQNPADPDPQLVFLGCSFTFGQGVNDSETLPYKFGALSNVSTLNLGGIGYGIHHVYKLFGDKYANKDSHHTTFIYTLIPDHILRAAGVYSWSIGPSFQMAGDSLVNTGTLPPISNRTAYYSSFFGCYSFIKDMVANIAENNRAKSLSPGDYEKAYLMIRNLDRGARATGGRFLLLFWDNLTKPGDPNRKYHSLLEAALRQLKADSVTLIRVSDILNTQDPKYYLPDDGHPNAMAYDTVARYLYRNRTYFVR